MANAYHNLSGWLRDVYAVLGDETELARVRRSELYELVAELIPAELWGGNDEPDADDVESPDADDDMVDVGPGDGSLVGPDGARPLPRGASALGRPSRMGNVLPREGGLQGTQRPGGNPAAVAGARPCLGVKRVGVIEVPLGELDALKRAATRARPTGRPARSRKSGAPKKGTRRATKK